MSARRRALALLAALLACSACSACGATSPQAPVYEAERVATALTGIAEVCGEAYQAGAPHVPATELRRLQGAALKDARVLARVVRKDRAWVYQSQTLGAIALESSRYLRSCALAKAAAALR